MGLVATTSYRTTAGRMPLHLCDAAHGARTTTIIANLGLSSSTTIPTRPHRTALSTSHHLHRLYTHVLDLAIPFFFWQPLPGPRTPSIHPLHPIHIHYDLQEVAATAGVQKTPVLIDTIAITTAETILHTHSSLPTSLSSSPDIIKMLW